jgi:hypothetical protein
MGISNYEFLNSDGSNNAPFLRNRDRMPQLVPRNLCYVKPKSLSTWPTDTAR